MQERIRESEEELRELEETRRYGGLTQPPRAPRPLRAPRAGAPMPPRPPMAVMPPAPPTPPEAPKTDKVRAQLRRDGLIGKDDKGFRFELNDNDMKVNGKVQSAAVAEKYRQLLALPKSGKGSRRSISMSSDE